MSDNTNVASIVQRMKLLSNELQELAEQLERQSDLGASANSSTKDEVSVEGIMKSLESFMTTRSFTLPSKVTYDRLGRILYLFWVEPIRERMRAAHISKRLKLQPISSDMHSLVRCGLLDSERSSFSLTELGKNLVEGRI